MSIQTELDRIIGLVHESHEKARAKGGTAATPLLANLPGVIESIPQGVELPTLTNPGSASDLLSGKQLIDADGNVVTGNIATKAASDLTASGATVTVPAGYYASKATKSVATATQATPSVSIDSAGKITASATQTAGYVATGTKTGTKQLTTQAAKTITPSTSSQTAVAKNVYTTGAVTVAAIPSTYVKPTATKGATTYTPTTSNQTIAAGTYCSGVQTIKGDANLKAENIAEGVSIFGVTGTHSGGGGSGGGGGSVETCTVRFDLVDYAHDQPGNLYYMKPDMSFGIATYQASRVEYVPPIEVTVIKNSIVVAGGNSFEGLMLNEAPENCEILVESFIYGMAFHVTGDSHISLTNM